jgi:thiol-disulfide isomerase/thioredoxin
MQVFSRYGVLAVLALSGWSLPPGTSSAASPAANPPVATATAPAVVIRDTYPDLASSGLTFVRLADLPSGTVLKAGDWVLTEKNIADEIAKAPKELQGQLSKNAFFLLEQMATKGLLAREANAKTDKDAAAADEVTLIKAYLGKLVENVKISDEEVAAFHKNNKDALGGAELAKVKSEITAYLRAQKQQDLVNQHVRNLGQRTLIEVSAAWSQTQAVLAKDNPVDKARASGKPSLVDFGSKGCVPCDMLAPILETLKTKYTGQANVLFVSVAEAQILALRFGIESIPVQIFFDKDGKEVARHVGFYPQEDIEKQMAKLGVK